MAGELTITETSIPGVLLLTLPIHGDNRGWVEDSWQRENGCSRHDSAQVTPVSTADYFADAGDKLIAPRPKFSTLE